MNEPSNFCVWPCLNPDSPSKRDLTISGADIPLGYPKRAIYQPVPEAPLPTEDMVRIVPRQGRGAPKRGLPDRNLTLPKYQIKNSFGAISNKTADTDLIHQGGWAEYDTHNL